MDLYIPPTPSVTVNSKSFTANHFVEIMKYLFLEQLDLQFPMSRNIFCETTHPMNSFLNRSKRF